jgi:hypothetical protein
MDEVEALAGAVYGTPEDVSAQIEILKEAGIEYLIVSLDPSRELETLEVFCRQHYKERKIDKYRFSGFFSQKDNMLFLEHVCILEMYISSV